jgi:pyruvate,water dikinase
MKTETLSRETKPVGKSSFVRQQPAWIKQFAEIGIKAVPLVGGKTASLGEMFRELASQGVRVPDGFAIAAGAYR